MTHRAPKDVVASVHQRLLNIARQSDRRRFNDLVMYYAVERFLYRLSRSRFADRVILKGGLMLNVWDVPMTRVTRDVDLLGKRLANDLDAIAAAVREMCLITVDDDGLVFDPDSVVATRISRDADYEGVRALFKGRFGKMPLAMQIDFGFSDVITPAPTPITYPTLLDHPAPNLLAYNQETTVAEKYHAMVRLGELNSRMRDFFDVWVLAKNCTFEEALLADALRATFARRETSIEVDPICFGERFVATPAKLAQWQGFCQTSQVSGAPAGFGAVVADIREFIRPVTEAIGADQNQDRLWELGGPWISG
jgi:Nucleotidyl transferase AbiEii toxin, Type IV TA system